MNEQEPPNHQQAPEEAAQLDQRPDGPLSYEAGEAEPRDDPRIYVASLSDYNASILHGEWIDAVDDAETMRDSIDEMLAASPTTRRYGDIAEEWAIHDYEGFGILHLDENVALSTIARLAGGITQHGMVFAAYAGLVGTREIDDLERFDDVFHGEWESLDAFAEDLLDQTDAQRIIDDAPEWLQPYISIDVAGFARDLELAGDFTSIEKPDGGVWVFGR